MSDYTVSTEVLKCMTLAPIRETKMTGALRWLERDGARLLQQEVLIIEWGGEHKVWSEWRDVPVVVGG